MILRLALAMTLLMASAMAQHTGEGVRVLTEAAATRFRQGTLQ
jgi:hypothetical protein